MAQFLSYSELACPLLTGSSGFFQVLLPVTLCNKEGYDERLRHRMYLTANRMQGRGAMLSRFAKVMIVICVILHVLSVKIDVKAPELYVTFDITAFCLSIVTLIIIAKELRKHKTKGNTNK